MRPCLPVLLMFLLSSSVPAGADEASSDSKPASWVDRIHVGGFVDAYFALNPSRPVDGSSFVPGTGSTAKRANELSLNLAALDVVIDPAPVGGHVTLNVGSGTQVIHSGEPTGPGAGPNVWQAVYQAYASYVVPVGRGLTVDAGIFPCHVGLEGFFSKDDWNYTRSWLGEFSPFYLTGVRATYPFTDHLSAQLHLVNGWQLIGDNNTAKTLGTQIAWNSDKLSLSFNTLAGPELANDNQHWRLLGDTVALVKPVSWLNLGASVDVGYQQLPDNARALWYGGAGYVRLIPMERLAFAVRAEVFADPDAGISGAAQTLSEATATIEYRPVDALILKLEARRDQSTADVFATSAIAADGTPVLGRAQNLALLSAVAAF